MKTILFVIALSLVYINHAHAEFTRAGDVVTHHASGLQWQDNTSGPILLWHEAIGYCHDLTLGGHSDWRLPNINELKSIIDRNRGEPAIRSEFINISYDGLEDPASRYWSSTSVGDGSSAWAVVFSTGAVLAYPKGPHSVQFGEYELLYDARHLVRCVRGG